MKKLTINVKTPYNVLIGSNILNRTGELVKNITSANKIAVITDKNVAKLYSQNVLNSLKKAGFNVSLFIFEPSESSKNLNTVKKIYKHLCKNNITRSDLLIALGGGITGDITGFAASSFLRGIDFINIPTSFLAQIDACIGGKVAVNLNEGKNLVGAFFHPKLVIIDTNTLNSLPKLYFTDAIGEAIKYALIKDENLFYKLQNKSPINFIEELIYKCLSIKKQMVECDELDTNSRMLLNFGHTIGHAVETYYNYKKFTHGSAVAIGMATITKLSENLNLTEHGTYSKIKDILNKYSLPYNLDVPLDNIYNICKNDKKNICNNLNLILLHNIGNGYIYKISQNEFWQFLKG